MKIVTLPPDKAEGGLLVHSVRQAGSFWRKGLPVTADLSKDLKAAGLSEVTVALPDEGDIQEDEAASLLAAALCGAETVRTEAATGRCNLIASSIGMLDLDFGRVHRINMLDERLTIATLPPDALVEEGQLVATIKVIPYFVPPGLVQRALDIAEAGPPAIACSPWRSFKTSLLVTELSPADRKLSRKGERVTRQRLERFHSTLDDVRTVPHTGSAIREALEHLGGSDAELILILGATAIADRGDIIPTSLEAAGGKVTHFGMPVDPGNLLLLGSLGEKTIVGIPGCARSPASNGFDLVLGRLHAGHSLTGRDLAHMGVGGLLKEIPSRPKPRENLSEDTMQSDNGSPKRIAAIVLAAGQSTRMGSENKLLVEFQGMPLIRHMINTLEESPVDDIIVVTGHEHVRLEKELEDCACRIVHNPDYKNGMSTSLKSGVAALDPAEDAALICLGDMPFLTPDVIQELVNAWETQGAKGIFLPVFESKRGHPVLWSREFLSEFDNLEGDSGAKTILQQHADQVIEVPVDSNSVLIDLDTPAAFKAHRQP